MHLAVIFENIGGYHAARLRAAHRLCEERGWRLMAIQIFQNQMEHPWGELEENEMPFSMVTVGDDSSRSITAMLERFRPDAVAIPGWGFSYSRAALRWCRQRGKRAIVMSESKSDDEPRKRWKEFLKSWLYVRRFDAGIVGAEAHREYLVELGMPCGQIQIGYDVVDHDYFATGADASRAQPALARMRQPLIPAVPYFLAVTRFIPRKNLLRLLQAYAAYRATPNGAPWDLVLCGHGSDEAALREFVRAHELGDCVHFPGFVTYREIPDWYGLAGAFVHPALQEQWGLVVNEAMAAALPVIVSDHCGCYPELVQPTGFGFDPLDVASLTQHLRRISAPDADRAALGAAARRSAERFRPGLFGTALLAAAQPV